MGAGCFTASSAVKANRVLPSADSSKGSAPHSYGQKSDYQVGKLLGRGYFAEVRECVHKATNQKYAVKIIEKSTLGCSNMEDIRTEIAVLRRAGHHPNVVALIDMFEDDIEVYIVMELCTGGDLFTHISATGKIDEQRAVSLCYQLASALQHLHQQGVIHRDLKPENVLLLNQSQDSPLKIADFGLSKLLPQSGDQRMQTVCGTWGYCAPEVILRQQYTPAVDNWTLGVLMYILLCGYHPFDIYGNLPEPQLLRNIVNISYNFTDDAWTGVSEDAKKLIMRLLLKNPADRLTFDKYLQSDWVKAGHVASAEQDDQLLSGRSTELAARLKTLADNRSRLRSLVVAKLASRRLRRLVKRKKELSRQYTPDEMEAVKRMIAQRDAGELSRDSSVSQLRTGDTDELSPVNGRETRHRSSCSIDKTADGFLLPPPSPAQGAHRRVRSTHVGSLTDMSLKVEPKAEVTLPGTATSESFEPGDSAPSKRSSTSITLSLFSQTASRAPFTRPRTLETTTKADAHFAMQNILHGGIIL